jgi:hypothetical protein
MDEFADRLKFWIGGRMVGEVEMEESAENADKADGRRFLLG